MQHQISLREANQHLSRFIKTVEQGDEAVITRRGQPVAKLISRAVERPLSPSRWPQWNRLATGCAAAVTWAAGCRRETNFMSAERFTLDVSVLFYAID